MGGVFAACAIKRGRERGTVSENTHTHTHRLLTEYISSCDGGRWQLVKAAGVPRQMEMARRIPPPCPTLKTHVGRSPHSPDAPTANSVFARIIPVLMMLGAGLGIYRRDGDTDLHFCSKNNPAVVVRGSERPVLGGCWHFLSVSGGEAKARLVLA